MSDFQKYRQIAKTILTSKNRTAYYVVWIKFLKLFFAPVDFLLSRFENVKKRVAEPPIVFVVGIQRTGSTFVSQILSNAFDFNEIGNFNSIFWRSRYFIHKWYNRFFKKKTNLKSFKSYYGISKGMSTVGDCYEVYDQWFGTDHYSPPVSLSQHDQDDMYNYFGRLHEASNKVILAKNNRNTLLVDQLKAVFPNAYFVVVKRNLVEVVRSTIQASYDFFGESPTLWGLYPKHSSFQLGEGSIVEQACKQCYYLNQELNDQLSTMSADSFRIIQYEDFCQSPKPTLIKIKSDIESRFNVEFGDIGQLNFEPFEISSGGMKKEYLKEIEQVLENLSEQSHAEKN